MFGYRRTEDQRSTIKAALKYGSLWHSPRLPLDHHGEAMNYEKCQKCETFHNLCSKHKATESRRRLAFRGVKRASSTFRLCQHGQDKPCNTYVGTAGHRVLQNSPRLSPEKTGMSCRLQNHIRGEEDIKYDEGPTETPASIPSTVNGFSFEFEFAFDFLPIVICNPQS